MNRKWIKGEQIKDPMVAVSLILSGAVIFERHKPQNAGWTQNWSIARIRGSTLRGGLFFALPAEIQEKGQAA
ncbi:hypothetical protein [Roseibium alexandrii]|uniref:hypothetical protein n=1 Tax=Roseibium alexandrii TaxID=388408 RepID=UPI00374FDE57